MAPHNDWEALNDEALAPSDSDGRNAGVEADNAAEDWVGGGSDISLR
jgi:hypothetical protein